MYNVRFALPAGRKRKYKRYDIEGPFTKMPPLFQSLSAKTLQPPPAPSRKPSQRLLRPSKDLDDFISSDLENSFASTMSLGSPPGSPNKVPVALSDVQSPNAMDVSPVVAQKVLSNDALEGRPGRRCVTAARSFGRELGNHLLVASHKESASARPIRKVSDRSPLPTEWLAGSGMRMADDAPPDDQDVKSSDAMDVDECILPDDLTRPTVEEPTVTFAPSQNKNGLSSLFFDGASSPPTRPKKRLSISPEGSPRQEGNLKQRYSKDVEAILQTSFEEPSSPAPPSPSARKFGRVATTGGLFGNHSKEATFLGSQGGTSLFDSYKRSKRPFLVNSVGQAQSAYGSLEPTHDKGFAVPPAPRRAFSTAIPPMPSSPGEGETDGPELSSPAAHALAKKQASRTLRRMVGPEDLKPSAASGALHQRVAESSVQFPSRNAIPAEMTGSPSARWLKGTGIPGFGDNEAHGKVLPCEKVPEDGLMRIDAQTLDALISGAYSDKIVSYLIIDCRFDYEYQGGHIKGAENINTTAEIEDFLLGTNAAKPAPSCSGDPNRKTVLVFHCEFSAKRAPTFAKHLRAKDRAMNNHVYPRLHYPEVYILKGGYHQYFSESAAYCDPHGYIRMDDPQFARDRRQDLDQFRTKLRFGRTKSYAFGETSKGPASRLGQQKLNPFSHHQRNSAPVPAYLMPSADTSRPRRSGEETKPYLATVDEDSMCGMTSMSSDESGILEGVEKSPCPPPAARMKSGPMGISMFNAKKRSNGNMGRGPLQRAQTVAQIR